MKYLATIGLLAIIYAAGAMSVANGLFYPNWRFVEVASIVLAGISLIAMAGQAGRLAPANKLFHETVRFENYFRFLQLMAKNYLTSLPVVAWDRLPTEHEWTKTTAEKFGAAKNANIDAILSFKMPESPPPTTDIVAKDVFDDWSSSVATFDSLKDRVLKLRADSQPDIIEEIALFLSPYLVAISMALALLKSHFSPT